MIENKRKKVRERSRAFRCRQTSNLACLLEWWLKRVDRSLPEVFRTFKDEPQNVLLLCVCCRVRASAQADDIIVRRTDILRGARDRPKSRAIFACACASSWSHRRLFTDNIHYKLTSSVINNYTLNLMLSLPVGLYTYGREFALERKGCGIKYEPDVRYSLSLKPKMYLVIIARSKAVKEIWSENYCHSYKST